MTAARSILALRFEPTSADVEAVRWLVDRTRYFNAEEIEIAADLVDERLSKGAASGYEFVFAEDDAGAFVGYACFGKNTVTVSSFDLYWIAVDPALHGQGLGRVLLAEAERQIAAAGGTRIYIETSHRPDYVATRGFYDRCGYTLATVLEDYYAPGDSKAVYVKTL